MSEDAELNVEVTRRDLAGATALLGLGALSGVAASTLLSGSDDLVTVEKEAARIALTTSGCSDDSCDIQVAIDEWLDSDVVVVGRGSTATNLEDPVVLTPGDSSTVVQDVSFRESGGFGDVTIAVPIKSRAAPGYVADRTFRAVNLKEDAPLSFTLTMIDVFETGGDSA